MLFVKSGRVDREIREGRQRFQGGLTEKSVRVDREISEGGQRNQ